MSSRPRIDLNCDVGESFGRWQFGHDLDLMRYVSSVSVAAGFHAGDPSTIRATVEAAAEHGLQIGVHVALPDLLGFGRRIMRIDPRDLLDYCTYQIGAVTAFAQAAGARVQHVKPHGALYVMASREAEIAQAVALATARADPDLTLLLLDDTCAETVAETGVRLVTEGFPDLHYDDDGQLVLERTKAEWDPEDVARRAVDMVLNHGVTSLGGGRVPVRAPTLCLHGDAPNAVSVARHVRRTLDDNGIDVVPLNTLVPRA